MLFYAYTPIAAVVERLLLTRQPNYACQSLAGRESVYGSQANSQRRVEIAMLCRDRPVIMVRRA